MAVRTASVVTLALVWFIAMGLIALLAGWTLLSGSVATILLGAGAVGASFGAAMRRPPEPMDRRSSQAAGD
jgi:hypothetical protein